MAAVVAVHKKRYDAAAGSCRTLPICSDSAAHADVRMVRVRAARLSILISSISLSVLSLHAHNEATNPLSEPNDQSMRLELLFEAEQITDW